MKFHIQEILHMLQISCKKFEKVCNFPQNDGAFLQDQLWATGLMPERSDGQHDPARQEGDPAERRNGSENADSA